MQDRFKFRIWNKRIQEYLNEEALHIIMGQVKELEIYNETVFLGLLQHLENEEAMQPMLQDHIIEQCTGCTDNGGSLIYEGDILEIFEDSGTSYVYVRWDDEFQKWTVEGDTETDYEFYEIVNRPKEQSLIDDVSLVGNIHENPELLEG